MESVRSGVRNLERGSVGHDRRRRVCRVGVEGSRSGIEIVSGACRLIVGRVVSRRDLYRGGTARGAIRRES